MRVAPASALSSTGVLAAVAVTIDTAAELAFGRFLCCRTTSTTTVLQPHLCIVLHLPLDDHFCKTCSSDH
jgi:hypothetical protein